MSSSPVSSFELWASHLAVDMTDGHFWLGDLLTEYLQSSFFIYEVIFMLGFADAFLLKYGIV